jgi:hypothetical protein
MSGHAGASEMRRIHAGLHRCAGQFRLLDEAVLHAEHPYTNPGRPRLQDAILGPEGRVSASVLAWGLADRAADS